MSNPNERDVLIDDGVSSDRTASPILSYGRAAGSPPMSVCLSFMGDQTRLSGGQAGRAFTIIHGNDSMEMV